MDFWNSSRFSCTVPRIVSIHHKEIIQFKLMFFLPFIFIATSVKKLKLVVPRAMILHGLFWSWWITTVPAETGKW